MSKVTKTSIRSYERYFGFLKPNEEFRLVIIDKDFPEKTFWKIGFKLPLQTGQMVLPSPSFGPVSRFNALGKKIKRKDLPMETAYRTVEWHWEEWHGPYERVPKSRFVDVPYQRYPREEVSPPSEELKIIEKNDKLYVSSRILKNTADKNGQKRILHLANLFLEVFGEVEIVNQNLESYYSPKEVKLNWQILPPGEYPWEKVLEKLKPLVQQLPEGNRPWAWHRIDKIKTYRPDFHAVGTGGFRGYVVFGFTNKDIYVLENIRYGNATYVFNEDWEDLSKLTKAEVIESESALERIIHRASWTNRIDRLLSEVFKELNR